MTTHRSLYRTFRTMARAAALALFMVGPLAGFAAAQDDGFHRSGSGAGFVLYVSILRNA